MYSCKVEDVMANDMRKVGMKKIMWDIEFNGNVESKIVGREGKWEEKEKYSYDV